MRFFRWLHPFQAPKPITRNQVYHNDRRYMYNLILLANGVRYGLTYGTSSPLNTAHRIVLAPSKAFTVTHIVHVTYPSDVSSELTRPTVFVHAGIVMDKGVKMTDEELHALGFSPIEQIFPYTIH